MNSLKLSPDLAFPIEYVTSAAAIVAKRGAGKTHTASVIAEEVAESGIPFVVLDPTGAWWGLRSSLNGTKPGIPVIVIGGVQRTEENPNGYGDVALEESAGEVIADLVVDSPGFYVIDTSLLPSKAAQTKFVTKFARRLFRRMAAVKRPLHLFLDEADDFAPQRPQQGELAMLGAMEDIVRRGRIYGLGITMISQRPAVLNKNVLTQCSTIIAHQITSPQDRNAVDDWFKGYATKEDRDTVLGSLARLDRGECWVWSPDWFEAPKRVKIRRRWTWDSSSTPKVDAERLTPTVRAEVDLEKLRLAIAETTERAREDDPKELKKHLAEARRHLVEKSSRITELTTAVAELERGNAADSDTVLLNRVVPALKELREKLSATVDAVTTIIGMAHEDTDSPEGGDPTGSVPKGDVPKGDVQTALRDTAPAEPGSALVKKQKEGMLNEGAGPVASGSNQGRRGIVEAGKCPVDAPQIKAGMVRMLAILNLLNSPLTRMQLGTLSDVKASGGTFRNYIGDLRRSGLIELDGDAIEITSKGLAFLSDHHPEAVSEAPATRQELLEIWSANLKLGERRMLAALVAIYPQALTKNALADYGEVTVTGGTFRNYLGTLRSNGLVIVTGDSVRGSDVWNLF